MNWHVTEWDETFEFLIDWICIGSISTCLFYHFISSLFSSSSADDSQLSVDVDDLRVSHIQTHSVQTTVKGNHRIILAFQIFIFRICFHSIIFEFHCKHVCLLVAWNNKITILSKLFFLFSSFRWNFNRSSISSLVLRNAIRIDAFSFLGELKEWKCFYFGFSMTTNWVRACACFASFHFVNSPSVKISFEFRHRFKYHMFSSLQSEKCSLLWFILFSSVFLSLFRLFVVLCGWFVFILIHFLYFLLTRFTSIHKKKKWKKIHLFLPFLVNSFSLFVSISHLVLSVVFFVILYPKFIRNGNNFVARVLKRAGAFIFRNFGSNIVSWISNCVFDGTHAEKENESNRNRKKSFQATSDKKNARKEKKRIKLLQRQFSQFNSCIKHNHCLPQSISNENESKNDDKKI